MTAGHDVLIATYHTVILTICWFICNDKKTSHYHMVIVVDLNCDHVYPNCDNVWILLWSEHAQWLLVPHAI